MDQALDMAKIAYEALDEKKGEAIKVIDISQISVIADYFIITNGTSDSQVKALVENVQEKLARVGHHPKQIEAELGYCWIMVILSYMYLIKRTVLSTIWSAPGAMGQR